MRELRILRDRMLETGEVPGSTLLRAEIARSWRRSLMSGVKPDGLAPRNDAKDPSDSQLLRAAQPVVEKLTRQLAGTSSTLLIADQTGLITMHWDDSESLATKLRRAHSSRGFIMDEAVVGTNGVGTTLEDGHPTLILGAEHFADAWHGFTCVGAPIRHPITGKIVGAINMTCRVEDTNNLMLPFAVEAAREIERRLYLGSSRNERLLLEEFLANSKRSTLPLIVVNDRLLISNSAAARVLEDVGQELLWEFAARTIDGNHSSSRELHLKSGGVLEARCSPATDGKTVIGATIMIKSLQRAPDPQPVKRPAHAARTSAPGACAATAVSSYWDAYRERSRSLSDNGLPLLIAGESGAGKFALARAVFAAEEAAGTLHVLDAGLQRVQGVATWTSSLQATLADARSVVVIRHVESLDEDAARASCAVLDQVGAVRSRVVATILTGAVHPPMLSALVRRLAVATVEVPPLRERQHDLPGLLAELTEVHALNDSPPRWLPEAVQILTRLEWPGNVRQLENLVRQMVAQHPRGDIRAVDLPADVVRDAPRRRLSHIERLEFDAIVTALQKANGSKTEAAAFLGISRATLYRKIRGFGIDLERAFF